MSSSASPTSTTTSLRHSNLKEILQAEEKDPTRTTQADRLLRTVENAAAERIDQAEQAIKAIKRHTEKETCPESLQYRARAKIRVDNNFKLHIKRIRKDAEQEVLKALTRFHQREIGRYRIAIKRSQRPRISEASNPSKMLTKTTSSASAVNNNITIKSTEQIAENIQASIAQFSEMMEKLGD